MPTYPSTPQPIAELHELLWQDLVQVHYTWHLWKELYSATEERFNSLQWASAEFFQRIHGLLLEDTILAIARLNDPPTNRQQENLVFEQLLLVLRPEDASLRAIATEALEREKQAASFAKEWRHKRLAHRDLAYARATFSGNPLRTTKEKIDSALASAADYLNTFDKHFEGRTTFFDDPITIGHERLFAVLRDARLFRDKLSPEQQFALRHDT